MGLGGVGAGAVGLRENLNRKSELFSHEDHGVFRLKFLGLDGRNFNRFEDV